MHILYKFLKKNIYFKQDMYIFIFQHYFLDFFLKKTIFPEIYSCLGIEELEKYSSLSLQWLWPNLFSWCYFDLEPLRTVYVLKISQINLPFIHSVFKVEFLFSCDICFIAFYILTGIPCLSVALKAFAWVWLEKISAVYLTYAKCVTDLIPIILDNHFQESNWQQHFLTV